MFSRIIGWLQGRTTAFAAIFTVLGTLLAAFHRLEPTYVALVATIMGYVLGHSIKEDVVVPVTPATDDKDPK